MEPALEMVLPAVTNVVAGVVAAPDRKDIVHHYIQHHVLYHVADGNPSAWNLPFIRVQALDVFRNDGVMLALALLLLVAGFAFLYRRQQGDVPRGWSNLLELFVVFVRNQIVQPYFPERDARRFAPVFCAFFFLILTLNLLGLCPLFSAATSNINVTGGLALVAGAFMVGVTIWQKGVRGFLRTFVPTGAPWILLPVLVPVEVISFFSRVFALAIRLFANVLAGHILIFALLSMVVLFGWLASPIILLVVGIYFFEIFMSFLQAYIFSLLAAIFIGQMAYEGH
ncbi:MAG TPA: F0F1 ATP synthase subunit A [Kiritimatiellia bacterium]|jgi:F-type H+-transporting ATPase subunit a|nr:F0F1 ATP synthase subunit A [Kiritimatiellia bacterium]OQC57896.1 MAG: ATP synthase subunit a [Verrucomicrobia bacterium ADurb.Bin018]MBP9572708.1 F0F1 ATP synthase subunit A [Kiritimatiellia bacterium]HOE01103.1 F0F1 ATP synthase subunit A [Kiritimatiellia bacterium]HQF21011.1 F0F1 ATP synthase subunit A [Kiritimatiellia bacterium]